MDAPGVPLALRAKLGEPAEGLLMMFAAAHRLATESFEHRLSLEMAATRVEISNLRFDVLKWCFVFWVGQVAVTAAFVSILLSLRG